VRQLRFLGDSQPYPQPVPRNEDRLGIGTGFHAHPPSIHNYSTPLSYPGAH
jgi:hypothetical protein